MSDSSQPPRRPGFTPGTSRQRQSLSLSPDALVTRSYLQPGQHLPLVIQPSIEGVDLIQWVSTQTERLEHELHEHGAILFRNFAISTTEQFEQFITASAGSPLEYKERSSPRSQVSGNIYTSTDYPADQPIFLHNENSYQQAWPLRIFFCCLVAAETGGETPLADVRRVHDRISPAIRERFLQIGVLYVRNFSPVLGLPWTSVFQTEDRDAVTRYCEEHGISAHWKGPDELQTRAQRPAILWHPHTKEPLWFNHAAFFHISTLPTTIRDSLLRAGEDQLPNNSYYGDGSPIEPEVIEAIRTAYQDETIAFRWQPGDVLMVDNMLVAHGRAPFTGTRKVVVGMTHLWSTTRG